MKISHQPSKFPHTKKFCTRSINFHVYWKNTRISLFTLNPSLILGVGVSQPRGKSGMLCETSFLQKNFSIFIWKKFHISYSPAPCGKQDLEAGSQLFDKISWRSEEIELKTLAEKLAWKELFSDRKFWIWSHSAPRKSWDKSGRSQNLTPPNQGQI